MLRRFLLVLSTFTALVVILSILLTTVRDDTPSTIVSWYSSCQGLFKQDFSTYWLWVTYWMSGHNPYDTDQLRNYAQSFHCTLTGSHYVPPFIVPLLAPIMVWPLSVAAVLWAVLNVVMVAHIARVLLGEWRPVGRMRGPLGIALALFSPSTASCIAYGQFGILCAWAMVVASRSAMRATSFLPGVLTLAAIKPHLGYLYWLGFIVDVLRTRKIGVCSSAVGLAALLTALVEWRSPGALASWIQGAGGALTWVGASPVAFLRVLFHTSSNPAPFWPIVAGPMIAFTYSFWCVRRERRVFDRQRDLPLFAALSVCSTPYLWSLDFPVLLVAELAVLAHLGSSDISTRRHGIAAAIVMGARVVLAIQIILGASDYRTAWYPAAILLAVLLAQSSHEAEGASLKVEDTTGPSRALRSSD